ncbi:hypothetical protein SBV42_00395 [Chlamydia crocodili]|uniref:Uncharacterized protein n=2 Tax=Chlamydia crocodili TaxID=2766982 RepID=A0ABX8CFK3_9CHLA|nr:hypothetical protein [Chlamydia crocodili]QVE49229.1 hypothetical protein H9Q19_00765 [Chlamydia crocodili]
MRKENLDALKSMGEEISNRLDKKYESLRKDYGVFVLKTQQEQATLEVSVNQNKDRLDQYRDSLNRQQKEIDNLNTKKSKKA